jgi:fumarylacetoacetase
VWAEQSPFEIKDALRRRAQARLEVGLTPAGGRETVISRSNVRELYYSAAQQLAHHTSCGCPMSTGDLLGSGTISGPEKGSRGSLLELCWNGKEPVEIDGGVTRTFLEDGDRLTIRGNAQGAGYRIGFGDCTGVVLPEWARDDAPVAAASASLA